VYDKEAIAILEALKKWRHYFLGNELVIKTDHQSLKFLMNQRLSEGIQHKLMLKLLEFNYRIEYKKGKENSVADALSRNPSFCVNLSVTTPSWSLEVENSYKHDRFCNNLQQKLALQPGSAPDYTLTAGILRYKGRILIILDPKLKMKILHALHSSAIGGHSGIAATYQRVKRIFHWHNLKKEVELFVSECPVCQ
jgi:hypothetical protein